jgi:hypothetical protein
LSGWLNEIGSTLAQRQTRELQYLPGPDDANRRRRLDWSNLMKRTWGIDVLQCPACGGKMDLIAVIEDAAVAAKILTHLGLPARPPPRGRPWRPMRQQQFSLDVDPDFDSLAVS